MDWDRAQWFTENHAPTGGILQIPYCEFTNILAEAPPFLLDEWRAQPGGWRMQGGIFPLPSYADWWCHNFRNYRKQAMPEGVYLDNVCVTASMNDQAHGAWRNEKNEPQAAYNLWDLRDMFRRVRAVLQETGPKQSWLELHMTHSNLINAMGYADVLYNGEDFFQKAAKGADFIDSWPLDMLTAINCPHTWGVPTRFLTFVQDSEEEWNRLYKLGYENAQRSGIGTLLLLDCYPDPLDYPMGNIRAALEKWGIFENDVEFEGYWRDSFKSGDNDVLVAAFQQPEKLLLVIQNRDRAGPRTPRIRFTPKNLGGLKVGDAAAFDQEQHAGCECSLRADGGEWVLQAGPIPPRDFRLIAIAKRQ